MLRIASSLLLVAAISALPVFAQTGAPPGLGANKDSAFDPNAMLKNVQRTTPVIGVDTPLTNPPQLVPSSPPPAYSGTGSEQLFPSPPPAPPPKIWSGGAEAGFNGATGNSELQAIRVSANARRKTATNLFDTDVLYAFTRTNGVITQQQAIFNARDELLVSNTAWSLFASTNLEYDELRTYRFRVGGYLGVGYTILDDSIITWRGRFGAGVVYEIGSENLGNRFVPEMLLGTDLTLRLTERQAFVSTVDYYPKVDNWGQYRVRARLAYQILLDPRSCLTLKIGIQDRYDSHPGNARPNDLNYFTSLGFTF